MGSKKSQNNNQRPQQSFQQMVQEASSNTALNKMMPEVEKMVRSYVQQLGQNLAVQQASTLETLFARVVVLETIVMEKLGYSTEDLTEMVAKIEDEKENLQATEQVEVGDVVRLEVSTKTNDQADFQGTSRLKIYETGSGQTLGPEMESAVIGMRAGETKEVTFGQDKQLTAKITINRCSRKIEAQG